VLLSSDSSSSELLDSRPTLHLVWSGPHSSDSDGSVYGTWKATHFDSQSEREEYHKATGGYPTITIRKSLLLLSA
jgi:hypothetical protein